MLSRPTTNRLLVRHFLRRFLEHDLVSPQTDQREALAITATVIVVSTLFLAFFLAVKYQFNLFMRSDSRNNARSRALDGTLIQ